MVWCARAQYGFACLSISVCLSVSVCLCACSCVSLFKFGCVSVCVLLRIACPCLSSLRFWTIHKSMDVVENINFRPFTGTAKRIRLWPIVCRKCHPSRVVRLIVVANNKFSRFGSEILRRAQVGRERRPWRRRQRRQRCLRAAHDSLGRCEFARVCVRRTRTLALKRTRACVRAFPPAHNAPPPLSSSLLPLAPLAQRPRAARANSIATRASQSAPLKSASHTRVRRRAIVRYDAARSYGTTRAAYDRAPRTIARLVRCTTRTCYF